MVTDALSSLAGESPGLFDGGMEGKHPIGSAFLQCLLECYLIRYPLGFDFLTINQHFPPSAHLFIEQIGGHHRDDDLVVTDDSLTSSLSE